MSADARLQASVATAVQKLGQQPGPLLEILHSVQNDLGHVPADAIPLFADALNLSRAVVECVISFYLHFGEVPAGGRLLMELCLAVACLSMGAAELAYVCRRLLGVELGATSSDGRITLEPVYCLGLCACAPAALVNGRPEGRLDAQGVDFLMSTHEDFGR